MTHTTSRARRFFITVGSLVLLVGLAACGGSSQEGSEAPQPAAATAGGRAAGPGTCQQYAKRVCEAAGAQSATCAAMRAAAPMMAPQACAAGIDHFGYTEDKLVRAGESCDSLVERLCAELGEESETCALVRQRTQELSPSDCALMEQHYDEVLADLKRVQKQNQPLAEEELSLLTAGEDLPSFGPEDAEVVMVAFSDFQCPYCARAADVTSKVREAYGDQVRFVFRQFPLPFHDNAQLAAEAALAAHAQGKFWEYHDLLFDHQDALDRDALESYAEQLDLDMEQFNEALDESTYADEVERDVQLGKQVGVRGTPTMYLGTQRVPDPTDFGLVSERIDARLEEELASEATDDGGKAEAAEAEPEGQKSGNPQGTKAVSDAEPGE